MKNVLSIVGRVGSKLLSIVSGLLALALLTYSGYAIYDSV